jgi:hypothetical protein
VFGKYDHVHKLHAADLNAIFPLLLEATWLLVQVLSQAVAARAPYAVLMDEVIWIFFRIEPCFQDGKVAGWHVSYCVKHMHSDGPSVYQLLHRLLREELPPASMWPTPDRMLADKHLGFPIPFNLLKALIHRDAAFLKELQSGGGAPNGTSAGIEMPEAVTEDNFGQLVRAVSLACAIDMQSLRTGMVLEFDHLSTGRDLETACLRTTHAAA